MTKTEYQDHLIKEYASYLRKAVANKSEDYVLSPQNLASALLKAFEKGATKGVLYESLNDVERLQQFTKSENTKEEVKKEVTRDSHKDQELDEALKAMTKLFVDLGLLK